ncbi:hypothetical protein BGX24_008708 [Mortierella sp. AD032]|nr:hypothetical protein BGX24_008708 [Mortierella sp. AD032]
MLSKALLLFTASLAYITAIIPPKASSSQALDSAKSENSIMAQWYHPYILAATNALETGLYLMLLMGKSAPFLKNSDGESGSVDAIRQLQVLKIWHMVMTFGGIAGCVCGERPLQRWADSLR